MMRKFWVMLHISAYLRPSNPSGGVFLTKVVAGDCNDKIVRLARAVVSDPFGVRPLASSDVEDSGVSVTQWMGAFRPTLGDRYYNS